MASVTSAADGAQKLSLQSVIDEAVRLTNGSASRSLAAFVACMVAYRSGHSNVSEPFSTDVSGAVAAFVQSEHPSAVSVRMQTAFESSYYEASAAVDRARRGRIRRMDELVAAIEGNCEAASTDLSALAAVYKQMLSYITVYLSIDPAAAGLKAPSEASAAGTASELLETAQREMQAAMESVFPRVGVKKFTSLSREDKLAELDEIAHLVLGIRLFNWQLGKGGAVLEDTPTITLREAEAQLDEIEKTLVAANELSQQYIDTLVAVRSRALVLPSGVGVNWPSELLNRRQLCAHLNTVADELRAHIAALQEVINYYTNDLKELRAVVGEKASVSKEVVYPRFHNVASRWLKAAEIKEMISATTAAHKALASFIPTTVCSLSQDVLRAARTCIAAGTVSTAVPPPPESALAAAHLLFSQDPGDRPLKLSLEHSAEFLQLPLDYQGFCPVTLAVSVFDCPPEEPTLGILVAGDPAIGVIRWRNKHVVCANAEAAEAFCAAPHYYTKRLHTLATRNVELVHLLQLHTPDGFPNASLPAIVQYDGYISAAAAAMQTAPTTDAAAASADTGARLSSTGKVMIDKTVETPVHFVERHIDPHYEWNEWALRRKALAIMNLRNCKTTSAQTDASHFRRDNDTQVYLPKAAGTQTGISVSTNTTRVVRYIGGLRGMPEEKVDEAAETRGIPTKRLTDASTTVAAKASHVVASSKVSVSTHVATETTKKPAGMTVVTLKMDF